MTHRSSWVVKSLRNRKYGPVRLLTCKVCFQACQLTCSLELASVRFECSHRLVLLGGHISGRNALVYIVYLACFRSRHKPSSSFKQWFGCHSSCCSVFALYGLRTINEVLVLMDRLEVAEEGDAKLVCTGHRGRQDSWEEDGKGKEESGALADRRRTTQLCNS